MVAFSASESLLWIARASTMRPAQARHTKRAVRYFDPGIDEAAEDSRSRGLFAGHHSARARLGSVSQGVHPARCGPNAG